ncbi:YbaY family lipoprotein [Streptomyces sp. KLMMK]|uniref:YbaY family lipoprotein n=1 Tax=Streptomyces sp. KLMMK TaxID=3109353 RepID=UPI0030095D9B
MSVADLAEIEVEVTLAPGAAAPRTPLTLHVTVEDTSTADAPSRTVAHARLPRTRLDHPPYPRVRLAFPPPPPGTRYTIRAHADLDDSGTVTHGDWITRKSHPATPPTVTVELSPVP